MVDRRGRGGNGEHICDERLRAARSAGKRAASDHTGVAGADGDRGGHHRGGRAHGAPRRAPPPSHAGAHHPAQRDRPAGAKPDRGRGQARHAEWHPQRTARPLAVRRRTGRRVGRHGRAPGRAGRNRPTAFDARRPRRRTHGAVARDPHARTRRPCAGREPGPTTPGSGVRTHPGWAGRWRRGAGERRRAPPCPGDNQRGDGDVPSQGDRGGRRRRGAISTR